jgi:hypothetical protein
MRLPRKASTPRRLTKRGGFVRNARSVSGAKRKSAASNTRANTELPEVCLPRHLRPSG